MKTLAGFATDAAQRSADAYEQADALAEKAREAALAGNEEAAMEYLAQAEELIGSIDADYLKFGNTMKQLNAGATAAKDAMGKILLPALQSLGGEGAKLLDSFATDMEAAAGDTEAMGQIMADYLQRGIELIREKLPEFGQIAVDLLKGLGEGIQDNLPEMLDDILGIVDYILETIEGAAPGLGQAASTLITTLLNFLLENAPDLMTAGISVITEIMTGLADAMPALIAQIPALISNLLSSFIANVPQLLAAGVQIIGQILVGLAQAIPDLIAQIIALPGQLIESFRNADVDWGSIGSNIIDGIKSGIANAWGSLTSFVSESFDNLIGSIAGFLGIHSPSTLFRDKIGVNMAAGIGEGFGEEMQDVASQMQSSLNDAMPSAGGLDFNASVVGADGSSGGTNFGGVTLIVNGYNVQDDDELAERISYRLQQLFESQEA